MNGLEDIQKLSKDNMDIALKSFGAMSKGVQALGAETADYTKKSFEEGTAAVEKMMGVKSLDKAMEVQADYMKSSYEGFVGQVSKMGEMYVDIAKEAFKPYEDMLGKVAK